MQRFDLSATKRLVQYSVYTIRPIILQIVDTQLHKYDNRRTNEFESQSEFQNHKSYKIVKL